MREKKEILKRKIKELKAKKGFTLIELIVVIAVLGILVLLAAPKFLGYTAEARMAQVKADIKSYQNLITAELSKDPEFSKDWVSVEKSAIEENKNNDSLYGTKGQIGDEYVLAEEYLDIPEEKLRELIHSKLPGNFVWGSDDRVYYIDENLAKVDGSAENGSTNDGSGGQSGNSSNNNSQDTDGDGIADSIDNFPNDGYRSSVDADGDGIDDAMETTFLNSDPTDVNSPVNNGNGTYTLSDGTTFDNTVGAITLANGDKQYSNGMIGHQDGSVTTKNGTVIPATPKSDFVKQTDGTWKYVGTNTTVVVSTLDKAGNPITTYKNMFNGNTTVTKVVALPNPRVTEARGMFEKSKVANLDISDLDTSLIKDMSYMFSQATGPIIGLDKLNTSAAETMSYMFSYTNFPLDLSNFDTRKVKDMSNMFNSTGQTHVIDVTPLDTENVEIMSSMFAYYKSPTITGIETMSVKGATSVGSMFRNSALPTLDLSQWKFEKEVSMTNMFFQTTLLKTINLNGMQAPNVIDMSFMFQSTALESVDLSTIGATKAGINLEKMFSNVKSMKNLDLTSVNVAEASSVEFMIPEANFGSNPIYLDSQADIDRILSVTNNAVLNYTVK